MEIMSSIDAAIEKRAHEIYDTRRQALYVTADRSYRPLLAVQWLGAYALGLLQFFAARPSPACEAVSLWGALSLGGIINAAPYALIHLRPGRPATRWAIAISQSLFYILLLRIVPGSLDVRWYVFAALAFLTFYRDWRLLALMGGVALAAQYAHTLTGCGAAEATAAQQLQSFVEFAIWVALEICVLVLVCNNGTLLFRNNARESAQLESERKQAYEEVLARTRQLEASNEQYRALLESTSAVPWELDDTSGACTYIGAQVERQWGWVPERFKQEGYLFSRIHSDDQPVFAQALEDAVASHDVVVECRMRLACEKLAHTRSFIRHAPGGTAGRIVRGISIDITTQKTLELELQQAQKLESVGRLAAGIAHEINTPVQFIGDSCHFLRDAVGEIGRVLAVYRAACSEAAAGAITSNELLARVRAAEAAADIVFLAENAPAAVERSLEGLERVATIVRSMKEFSHQIGRAHV